MQQITVSFSTPFSQYFHGCFHVKRIINYALYFSEDERKECKEDECEDMNELNWMRKCESADFLSQYFLYFWICCWISYFISTVICLLDGFKGYCFLGCIGLLQKKILVFKKKLFLHKSSFYRNWSRSVVQVWIKN